MTKFLITNIQSGIILGEYDALDGVGALDTMARDAGYSDYAEACAVAPAVEDEIIVEEIL